MLKCGLSGLLGCISLLLLLKVSVLVSVLIWFVSLKLMCLWMLFENSDMRSIVVSVSDRLIVSVDRMRKWLWIDVSYFMWCIMVCLFFW